MDCADFERRLVDLLDDGLTAGERQAMARGLRTHAEECPHCRPSLALVRELALPPGERDPLDGPGPRYWREFDERLSERIEAERRAPRKRRWRVGSAAAAAVVLLALGAWWIGRDAPGLDSIDAPLALSPEIDQQLREAPDRALRMSEELADTADDAGWLPQEVFELDEAERAELLRWLNEQDRALPGGRA